MENTTVEKIPLCPSARPTVDRSVVFGVVNGTADRPRVVYLKHAQTVTEELVAKVHPVTPAEVLRAASPCETKACQHFDGTNCRLATRVSAQLPAVAEQLPPCAIRRDCRWWQQEGSAVCFRCPQVITDNSNPSTLMKEVSTPAVS
ncbi:hypothetical protein [Altericista sp. CCNU0014]|uniref:hypothetical protein n=1 Tax=Altericista sp. CCNU0014 TaxID=3082949 RepID=UPI003850CF94